MRWLEFDQMNVPRKWGVSSAHLDHMDQYFRGQPPTEMIQKERVARVLFQPCIFSETFVVSFRGDVRYASVVYWSVFG